jgi:hypothetical protein
LNITSNTPANCTSALQRKASFVRLADDVLQCARSGRLLLAQPVSSVGHIGGGTYSL